MLHFLHIIQTQKNIKMIGKYTKKIESKSRCITTESNVYQ